MSYLRPTANREIEQVIKKSLFIAQLAIVENGVQANEFISQIKKRHPKANHNCHCYIAGAPEQSSLWAYSDDGEPKGCAGLPMFQVIKHSGLGNLCIVVTRYFGGIKLGTGGMARAYSSTVNLVLDNIETIKVHPLREITLSIPFQQTGTIEHILATIDGIAVTSREWNTLGQQFRIEIEEPSVSNFVESLRPLLHLIEITPPLTLLLKPTSNHC